MAWTDLPPGAVSNTIDLSSQLNGNIALHTICLTLATAAVAMRLYTRISITRVTLGLDD